MKKVKLLKIFMTILLVVSFFIIIQRGTFNDVSPQNIREFLGDYSYIAPIIYIIMFTFVPLTLFPDSALAIAGGMSFGIFWGSIYTIIGALCGGSLAYFLAKFLFKDLIAKLLKNKELFTTNKNGFILILTLRLIPLIPFDLISYGAGAFDIKYRDFFLATLIGIIPGVLVFANIGDKALDINSPAFYTSIIILIGLILSSKLLKKKIYKKGVNH
ncbi:TVP38/TMEM64 family protein, partial [Caloramator mitchellensis]|uniref:TVP38/TMEM64 family protein n=1 Tax=Caloramator mitchellensis TaxID=908809 RepID=UPI0007173355